MNIDQKLFKTKIKPLFARAPYCSIATVHADGTPHVTPIGSVVLKDLQSGWFFQKFTKRIPQNAETCETATIMAVNAGRWFWLKSLIKGRFQSPPAMRLVVKLGAVRSATQSEGERFKRRVKIFKGTRGHKMMWQDMSAIREFEIIEYKPVFIGQMTRAQMG